MNKEPIFASDIRDLHIEAVLDGGFFDKFALETVIHSHSYHELMFCREGRFAVAANDRGKQLLEKGEFCLIPAGVYHHTCDTSQDAQKLAIRFHCTEKPEGEGLYQALETELKRRQGIVFLEKQSRLLMLTEQLRQEIHTCAIAHEIGIPAKTVMGWFEE